MSFSAPQNRANFHAAPVETVRSVLRSPTEGLSSSEAESRKQHFGLNELPQTGRNAPWQILWRQFTGLMTVVLLAAAILSAFFSYWLDAGVIIVVLLADAVIGFIQEYRAERSLEALQGLLVLQAKVYRDGRLTIVPAKDLVPGDLLVLADGDKVPADARLTVASNLQTSEASLTGESFPVEKKTEPVPEKVALAERSNMVWMGTLVVRGTAEAIVVGTGLQTAVGEIASQLAKIPVSPGHFERRMRRLTKQMALLALAVAGLTFVIGYGLRGFPLTEMLSFTVAALVSGIPESLPVILVIVLAVGARRMAKRNAIVRQLSSIETLGAVTVIVTDKTGTLTQNRMQAQAVMIGKSEFIDRDLSGKFSRNIKAFDSLDGQKLLRVAATCHSLRQVTQNGEVKLVGDPTEIALSELASSLGQDQDRKSNPYRLVQDLGFVQEKRWRASLVQDKAAAPGHEIFVVGAPEAVLSICQAWQSDGQARPLTVADRERIQSHISQLTDLAMRVVVLAYRPVPRDQTKLTEEMVSDLVYLGAVGLLDPPRLEVAKAIESARTAGIKVIMATGDHPLTAVAIGRQIGLIGVPKLGEVINGSELETADDAVFDQLAGQAIICARFTPTIKLKLAAALQRRGEIVAMTGDGVNDAPALKQADVGISMAITGTEVAREASEIVLADDNFASIINAIEEGRTQFRNARRAVLFLVTTNLAESATILITMMLGWPLPLLPTQILWLNLVTDGVTDVALAVEPSHEDVLKTPPRPVKEQILNLEMLPFLLISTVVMAILTTLFFWLFWPTGLAKARTGAFAVMAWTQLMNMISLRSLKGSVFHLAPNPAITAALVASVALLLAVLYTPWLKNIFQFVSLSFLEMLVIVIASSTVIWALELYKYLAGKPYKNKVQ